MSLSPCNAVGIEQTTGQKRSLVSLQGWRPVFGKRRQTDGGGLVQTGAHREQVDAHRELTRPRPYASSPASSRGGLRTASTLCKLHSNGVVRLRLLISHIRRVFRPYPNSVPPPRARGRPPW